MSNARLPSDRVMQIVRILLLRDRAFWLRSRGRRGARFFVLAGYVYVFTLLCLLAMEDRLLFPAATVARPWLECPDYSNVAELTLESTTGERIHAWFTAPEDWEPSRGAVLVSHGNGSNLSRTTGRAYRWRESLQRTVLIYDYPGYGKSSGSPTEGRCYAAGEAAFHWLVEHQGVPTSEVILVGESLGGAIAVELATRHAVRLLVLHGAFTSFPDMAQIRAPVYPARYLVHNRMENEAKISHALSPVLITHGTADSVVPYAMGERLFAAAREPKLFIRMEGDGHGPPNKKDFFETVGTFLSTTTQRPPL